MAKNGNFVGRKDIPFDNDQIADILALKCGILEIFKGRDASVSFTQNQPSEHYFDDESPDYAKSMQTVFSPSCSRCHTTSIHPCAFNHDLNGMDA